MARFSVTFVKSSGAAVPGAAEIDVSGALEAAKEQTFLESIEDFADQAKTALVPEFVRDAITDATTLAARTMQTLDIFSGIANEVDVLESGITNLIDNAGSLVTAPADLALAIVSTVNSIGAAAANALGGLAAYEALFDLNPSAVQPRGSESQLGRDARRNAEITIELVQQAAAAGAAVEASNVSWAAYEDAIEGRRVITGKIDELLLTAGTGTFQALKALRAELVRSVPAESEDLPRIETLVLGKSVPSLVLAYRLYSDADRATEIVQRNRVENPAFVPGGTDLEVLVSA
jgi:prophage DNA circulation protein